MHDYTQANKELWDEKTAIHERSEFYGLEAFKAGKSSLKAVETSEVGDVSGKTLLHLQCHFGMDTLSWARIGAKTTGVDFSEKAIQLAQSLSRELGIKADFICSDIYDLPVALTGQFDIVFTSYGVLPWLQDLKQWAKIVAHFLKPGGFFYIVEGHPVLNIFDNSNKATDFKVEYSYFRQAEPTKWEPEGDYAEKNAHVVHPSYEWTYNLSDIITSLIDAGLRIDFFHEFPTSAWQWSPFTEKLADELWHVKGDRVPLTFSIKATKPE